MLFAEDFPGPASWLVAPVAVGCVFDVARIGGWAFGGCRSHLAHGVGREGSMTIRHAASNSNGWVSCGAVCQCAATKRFHLVRQDCAQEFRLLCLVAWAVAQTNETKVVAATRCRVATILKTIPRLSICATLRRARFDRACLALQARDP